ncbi:MAG: hypothetical protein IJU02_07325 [Lachnospiraceae bacterium]|nr:hypothetical protein [Lachnospiraceae bacterium]
MWKDLTFKEKSEIMALAVQQGITDLNEIKKLYNNSIKLPELIVTPDKDYNVFLNSLPPNQRYGDDSFNTRRYWELNGKPKDFNAALKTNPPMYTLEDDGYYHAGSIAYDKDNDVYEFVKSPDHDTVDLELLEYWNHPKNKEFREEWGLDLDSDPYRYVRRNSTDKPLYAYGGPLGNMYGGRGTKSQKMQKKKPYEPRRFTSVEEMIKTHEGFLPIAYPDGHAKDGTQWYSIGYGFNDSGIHRNIAKRYKDSGKKMTRAEADQMLGENIAWLDNLLRKNLGTKKYQQLTMEQHMAYLDTGYQRPATMVNAARLHRNTNDMNKVAEALAVSGFPERNADRYYAFTGYNTPPAANFDYLPVPTADNFISTIPLVPAIEDNISVAAPIEPLILPETKAVSTVPKVTEAPIIMPTPTVTQPEVPDVTPMDVLSYYDSYKWTPRQYMRTPEIVQRDNSVIQPVQLSLPAIDTPYTDYILGRRDNVAANGGKLFEDGGDTSPYIRNYQWRYMPETEKQYMDYDTGEPLKPGDKVRVNEQGKLVTADMPWAKEDWAVANDKFIGSLDLPEVGITFNKDTG